MIDDARLNPCQKCSHLPFWNMICNDNWHFAISFSGETFSGSWLARLPLACCWAEQAESRLMGEQCGLRGNLTELRIKAALVNAVVLMYSCQ